MSLRSVLKPYLGPAYRRIRKEIAARPALQGIVNGVVLCTQRKLSDARPIDIGQPEGRPVALVVGDRGLFDNLSGSSTLVRQQIECLVGLGFEVHVALVFQPHDVSREQADRTRLCRSGAVMAFELGIDVRPSSLLRLHRHLRPNKTGGRRPIPELLDAAGAIGIPAWHRPHYALVVCNYIWNLPVAIRLAGVCPVVLETHDIQCRQTAYWQGREATSGEEAFEIEAMGQADAIIALNREEFAAISRVHPSKTHLVYPSVPAAPASPAKVKPYGAVFVGSRHRPNYEGILWFVESVLPIVREACPGFTVAVCGSVCDVFKEEGKEEALKQEGVVALGRVDDLAAVYGASRMAIVPVHSGHGISIKTIEAMAHGMPVATTSTGIRGFPEDVSIPCADSVEGFASLVVGFLDGDAAEKASESSRLIHARHFSSEAYRLSFSAVTQSVLPRANP